MKTTTAPTRRLTTLEKRAKEFCEHTAASGSATLNVEWKKSHTWGYCPSIHWGGEKIAYASGCGYCKLSAVLAESLRFLCPDVGATGGAGVSSVQRALICHGWRLEQTASGDSFDGFKLTRDPQ